MQLTYGTYPFPVNAVEISTESMTNFNSGGQPYSQMRRLGVSGFLATAGQVNTTLLETQLRTALAVNFADLKFFHDDGSLSATNLLNAGSLTGVHVKDLKFTTTKGPEYANLRSFSFSAEAEYPLPNTANLLMSFSETVIFSGGGSIFKFRPALNGPSQKQMTYPQDSFRATQHGQSSGYAAPPVAPGPIWSYALTKSPDFTRTSPTRKGNGYEGYGLTWTYTYEDVGPLTGFPTLWIN